MHCPYYSQRERANSADIVFMPYHYLIDRTLRQTFKLDYKNSIIIIDEAHNIKDCAEQQASFDISVAELEVVIIEIRELSTVVGSKTSAGGEAKASKINEHDLILLKEVVGSILDFIAAAFSDLTDRVFI